MGANSFRKRVFQGPLTLGLHSTTFRSALPSATLPYPRQFFHRANRALVISLSSVLVGYDRRLLLRVLSQVFTCSGTRANSFTAQTVHLFFFVFFCSRRLEPKFAFRGCSHRFSPVRVPAQVSKPRKPPTSFFRSLHSPSVTIDVRFPRVLSQVFTCSGTRASSITALNRALVLFAFFCSRRLQPTFAFRGCSHRFPPVRVPAQVSKPRKPRTCLSRFFFVSVGYYRHSLLALILVSRKLLKFLKYVN